MSAYFITATGTNVGKTFTTCALLYAAKQRNIKVRAYKPIVSGWDASDGTDTAQILQASNSDDTVDSISPWRFSAPLAPHRAAALEGKSLSFDLLTDWTHSKISQSGLTLIEAVGGVMVPLDAQHTTRDWMGEARIPAILVVGSYLGTISHTLTALASLRQAGIEVKALVMCESDYAGMDFAEARAGLEPFVANIPLRIFQPRVSSHIQATAIASLVTEL